MVQKESGHVMVKKSQCESIQVRPAHSTVEIEQISSVVFDGSGRTMFGFLTARQVACFSVLIGQDHRSNSKVSASVSLKCAMCPCLTLPQEL